MIETHELAAATTKAVVVFASTNVDDIVLLSVLFADSRLRPRSVVMGQFIGIGLLVLVSYVAAVAAVLIPPGWTSLLGAVPLALGIYKGVQLLRSRRHGSAAESSAESSTEAATVVKSSQILTVVGVTVANGGDNLGVYIPLFAAERGSGAIAVYVAVFAVMTACWCALGYKLVTNRAFGQKISRYGHVVLPIVLVLLGLHILSGARVLVTR